MSNCTNNIAAEYSKLRWNGNEWEIYMGYPIGHVSLNAEMERLKAERDAAVVDMTHIANEIAKCKQPIGGDNIVSDLKLGRCEVCIGTCLDGECKFEWRGLTEIEQVIKWVRGHQEAVSTDEAKV